MASDRKSFLLRVDPKLLEAIQQWADDDLRSLNGQIEFLLRKSIVDAKRARSIKDDTTVATPSEPSDKDGLKG